MIQKKKVTLLATPILLAASVTASVASLGTAQNDAIESSVPQQIAAKLDGSTLQQLSLREIPAEIAAFDVRSSFAPGAVAAALAPGERFSTVFSSANGEECESKNFRYEYDETRGRFFITRREGIPAPQVDKRDEVSEGFAADQAVRQLAELGIPGIEDLRIHARRLMVTTRGMGDDQDVTTRAVGLKAFVERTLGGVPVLGHGLVFSYDLDGSFRKMIGRWTGLAGSGHKLRTSLSRPEIVSHVAAKLSRMGRTDIKGVAPMRFVYDPETGPDGTAKLTLKVEVFLDADRTSGGGKLRTLLIDLPD